MKTFARWIALFVLAGCVLEVFFIARIALAATMNPESTTFQRSEAVRIARDKGQLRWSQDWVPYTQISDNLKRAVIASEDDSFVNHDGVDWESLEKAWDKNQKAEERVVRGLPALPWWRRIFSRKDDVNKDTTHP